MRRSLLGLLTVVATAGLLIMAGCERSATLRVTSINGGNELRSDLADFLCYMTPDSEIVTLVQSPPDSVPVVLQYVEIGAGLPTWTPYEALLSQATVTFKSKLAPDQAPDYNQYKVTVPLTQAIPADATGKNQVTFWITPIPATWKQLVFDGVAATDDPEQLDIVDLAEATLTFSGFDSVANHTVSAMGKLEVEFGNFYDDTTRFGR